VYFTLDGADLGAGMLHPFIGRDDAERGAAVKAMGPVWDGNELWLMAAVGALFFVFPAAYEVLSESFFIPFLLIVLSLIVRGIAIVLRGRAQSSGKLLDGAIFAGSLVAAFLLGVIFGNVLLGIPVEAEGYKGSIPGLLNPYGLLTGALFVLLFAEHGALRLSRRASGDIRDRAATIAGRLWYALIVAAVTLLLYTKSATDLYGNYVFFKIMIALPALAVLGLLGIKVLSAKGRHTAAFYSSCLTIVMVLASGVFGLFPRIVSSSLNPAYTLNVFNSSAGESTLKTMTVAALVFFPIVIVYQIWACRSSRRKLAALDAGDEANPG
jgi:cytochrome d ubiquinol oxidase subunit II